MGLLAAGGAAAVLLVSACSGTDENLSQDLRLSDRGFIAMNDGDLLDAEIYLEAALQTNPANPYALLNMGVVYQRTGRIDLARKMYAKVVELDPQDVALGSNEEALAGAGLADIARANLADLAQDDLVAVRQVDPSQPQAAARFLEILELYRDAGAISEQAYGAAARHLTAALPSASSPKLAATDGTVEPAAPSGGAANGSVEPVQIAVKEPGDAAELLAHIASYRSPENAERGWGKLTAANGDLLSALSHEVREVDLGPDKGVFFRLFAGPLADRAAADTLCGALKSRGLYCMPMEEPAAADSAKRLQTASQ